MKPSECLAIFSSSAHVVTDFPAISRPVQVEEIVSLEMCYQDVREGHEGTFSGGHNTHVDV